MASFHQRSIAKQVRWALGVLMALTTLGSLVLLSLARRASDNAVQVYQNRLLPIQELMEVTECYTVNITFALREVRGGQMTTEDGLRLLKENEVRAAAAWDRYRAVRSATPAVRAAEGSLRRLRYLSRELAGLFPAGVGKDLGIFGDTNWMPEVLALSRDLQALREEEDRQAQATIRELQTWSRRSVQAGLALLAFVLSLTVAFGRTFSGYLRDSFGSLLAHLRQVADGNLEPIPVAAGEGELALAERELNRTASRLRRLMTDIQDQETRYRLMAERLPDVVYQTLTWPDGRRAWPFVSPQFEAFYGIDAQILEIDPTYSFRKIHPEDQAAYTRSVEEATRRMGPMEWEGRSFTERPFEMKWIRVRRSPTPRPDGSVMWDGVLEDITTLKQSEEALRWSEARAQEASQAKSAFLASMSHELRTPLSAILGYSRLMAREPGRSESDQIQLQQVLRAGEHLLSLINDVLSLSKIEAGRMELNRTAYSPLDLVHELESFFRPAAQTKGLAFEVDVQSLPPQLEGDLPKLRQVLVNLLGNALKFTAQGSVRLAVAWHGDVASFWVEDTGPGISKGEQARLFVPFSQASLGQAAGGTGLGLHISRTLVSMMGGSLLLESEVGRGSQFHFDLPLPQPELPALLPSRGQVIHLAEGEPSPALLIVDDRPDNRDMLDRLLTLTGFRCILAENGAQALSLWEEKRPDLILMDLRMPEMDGFQAVARLRSLEAERDLPRTPVVAISASVYDVTTEDLIHQGFDAFLTKPIDEEQLFQNLEAFLGLHFQRQAVAPPQAGPGLEGLTAQNAAWRKTFLDKVATGDLEAAEALLPALPDPGLAGAVRDALRAYHLEEILKQLQ